MEAKRILASRGNGVKRASRSADGNWAVEHLIPNVPIKCLAEDKSNPERIFAGSDGQGVWLSEDAGLTWKLIGLEGVPIRSIAVSPHDAQTIYAGGKPAVVFKTMDGGDSWNELESFRKVKGRWYWWSPAEPPDRRPYVFGLSVSPTEPDVVLAGVELGAVVRSEDGGRTWSNHLQNTLRDCHSLKFHPTNGDWAYEAGGSGGGAAFSRDGGRTWRKFNQGLAKSYGVVCGADADHPEIWYVAVAPSPFKAFTDNATVFLYRSRGGAGWEPVGWQPHPLNQSPTALASLPGAPGSLYAGLFNGDVMYSSDYGDSWKKLPFNLGGIWFSMVVQA